MMRTLAGASAELVKNDPLLVQRAAEAFIAKEIRHQHNRESVAIKAIEHLKETPEAETAKPEDDWLNMYARHAQEASSERLQDIWGRVLAGQLRAPRAFSLQTLRFVSELDEHMVTLFEKWSPRVVNRDFIPNPPKQGAEFSELIELEDFGIIVGATGNLSKNFTWKEEGSASQTLHWAFNFKDHDMIVMIKTPLDVVITTVLLTRVGREIYSITRTKGSVEPINAFADYFPKHNVEQIACMPNKATAGEAPMILWSKPPEQSPQAA
jgi:hypothetical protein